MVEGVLVMDAQGVVQLANEAARRALRVRDDPVGRRYVELVRHPDIEAQISRALRGEPTDAQELTIAQEPAQTIMAQATRVSGEGSQGVVLVLHDITGLRRADRIRRDFVANVSHELRTPLTAIRGYVEALIDGAAGCRAPPLFDIMRATEPDGALVKDLRLTRSRLPEPARRVARRRISSTVVHDLEPLARRHQEIAT
jgi:two-component system phosphate regulon sensor histidine kinase PhoR